MKPRFLICVALGVLMLALIACRSGPGGAPPEAPTIETPFTAVLPSPTPLPAMLMLSSAQIAERMGVDLGGVGDRALEFPDVAKTLRRWEKLEADACPEGYAACRWAPLDADGWPTTDARTVFFDMRPFGAWWSADQSKCPYCQDGEFQIDMSGTYALAFNGQATLQAVEGMADIRNQRYDVAANLTTAEVVVAPGQGLLFVAFVDTRRSAEAGLNTGITNVHLMRPGYALGDPTVFTPGIIEAVKPFSTLRFMNWVGGNNINPEFDPAADCTLDWSERNPPTARQNQGEGVAWEYVVELANLTRKNIWINVPIHASDDYVRGLATFLHDYLHPDAIIYLEYSNEVWNPGFAQEAYNRLAAVAEVKAGDSALNRDNIKMEGLWAQRRYARRLVEISQIFSAVFGADAVNTRFRVIHSWWALTPTSYEEQLRWIASEYGPPKDFLYAVALAGYFNIEGIPGAAPQEEIYRRLWSSIEAQTRSTRVQLREIADRYDLQLAMYEGGPDTAGPLQWDRNTRLLEVVTEAHRAPGMRDLILYDLWNAWFAHPQVQGDIFIYFTLQSQYNRWGMWGLTEDITALDTPKYRAITDLVGLTQSPPPRPFGLKVEAVADGSIALTWSPSFSARGYRVERAPAPVGEGAVYTVLIDGLTETIFLDTGLAAGSYAYQVTALNAMGASAPSWSVEATVK